MGSGYNPDDVAATSVVAAFLICVAALIIGYRLGVVRTRSKILKDGPGKPKPKKSKLPPRFRPPAEQPWRNPVKGLFLDCFAKLRPGASKNEEEKPSLQQELFGAPQADVPLLTTASTTMEAQANLERLMEHGQIAEIELAVTVALQHGVDQHLITSAKILIQRLTDGYLGFDGPGALHKKATAARLHEEACRSRLEELDAEKHAAAAEKEQLVMDKARFEEEMGELRAAFVLEQTTFRNNLDQERENMIAEFEAHKSSTNAVADQQKEEIDQRRMAFAEEVEVWTKKRNAEISDIHRIRRELDSDAVKRASEAAQFAANVTRVLSGLEMALAKQDEDTGQPLPADAWLEALDTAVVRARELSWSQMPEVHEMFKLAEYKLKIVTANRDLSAQIDLRVNDGDPLADTGLEPCLFKVRGLEGLDVDLVNRAVALAKLRLAINIGNARAIKEVYRAACANSDGKEPFLLMATAVLERCAATEVLAEALEHQDVDHLGAAITAGDVVLKNIERHDAAAPRTVRTPQEQQMDLMMVTQVLHATGYEFGHGVETLTRGLRDIVTQATAVEKTVSALKSADDIKEEELVGNPGRRAIDFCIDCILDLTWRNDSNLKPIFLQARARSKALEADEMLKGATDLRMANPNPTISFGLEVYLDQYKDVPGVTMKLVRQAQLAIGLKESMVNNDLKLMSDVMRMMYIPSGKEPPLVRAAEVQCARLRAEDEIMAAMDAAALRDSLDTADINNLNNAVQRSEKLVEQADELIAMGALEYYIKGNLATIVSSAKLMVSQLRAVHEMMSVSADIAALQRAITAAEETEQQTKEAGAKTSIEEDIVEYRRVLATLRAKKDLQEAIDSKLLPRVKAALDVAKNNDLKGDLVDNANQMLLHVNAISITGAFGNHNMGGRRYGKDWLSNPQYKLTVEGDDAPVSVSITLVENSSSTLGVFALDVRRNHEDQGPMLQELGIDQLVGDNQLVVGSEYNESISELSLNEVPVDQFPVYIVPSCFIKNTEGAFTITIMSQTHGTVLKCEPVVKVEDSMLAAMDKTVKDWDDNNQDNSVEGLNQIAELMGKMEKLGIENEVVEKGRHFLSTLKVERELVTLIKEVEAGRELAEDEELIDPELMERFAEMVDGLKLSASFVNPAVMGQAKQMVEQMQAEHFMRENAEKRDTSGLEFALQLGQDSACSPKILAKYGAKLKFQRAELAVEEALADLPDFDFDKMLVAFNNAKAVGLIGERMQQISRLLEMPGTLKNTFEKAFNKDTGAKGTEEWVNSPQYRVRLIYDKKQRIAVTFSVKHAEGTEAGASREAAMHVLRTDGESFQAASESFQICSTEYADTETQMLSFEIEPDFTYFVIPSMRDPNSTAEYTIELHQPCQRSTGELLCVTSYVDLVQNQLAALLPEMKCAFGQLTPKMTLARDSASKLCETCVALGLTNNIMYQRTRLRMLQLSALVHAHNVLETGDNMKLRKAIGSLRASRVPGAVVHMYEKVLWEREINTELNAAVSRVNSTKFPPLSDNVATLRALLDVCEVYDVQAENCEAAIKVLSKLHHVQVHHRFSKRDGSAVGRPEMGRWRSNPTLQIDLSNALGPQMISLSMIRDAKAHIKDADDVEGVEDEDEKEFDKFAVHVVRNTASDWAMGGVGVDYEIVASVPCDSTAPKVLTVTLDPAQGPYFMVPSTQEEDEEGWFTVSLLAPKNVVNISIAEKVKPLLMLSSAWVKDKGGAYGKNGTNPHGKSFKVGKTWLDNPQVRMYLNWDAEKKRMIRDGDIKEATITAVLSTPIDMAEPGMHLVRNKVCTHHNEHMDALQQRYSHLVDYTEQYVSKPEIQRVFVLKADEGTDQKNGCMADFPFFLVPSLHSKMAGKFFLTLYCDQPIGIEMVQEKDRIKSGRQLSD